MVVRKTNPQGVDKLIDKIQVHLNVKLSLGNWDNNHRAYKNPKREGETGLTAEVYTENGEYRDCFFNDNFTTTTFFITDDVADIDNGLSSQEISCIFQCRISDVYTTQHRADEELRNDVLRAFNSFPGRITLNTIETGIENVYREFNTDALKYDDMSSIHVLRVNFTGVYETTCCVDC